MLFESVPVFLKWVQERCDTLELKVETNLLLSLVVLTLRCFVETGEYGERWKNLQLVEMKHHPVYYSGRKMTREDASEQPVVRVRERVPWVCFEWGLDQAQCTPPKSNYVGGQLLPLILPVPVAPETWPDSGFLFGSS